MPKFLPGLRKAIAEGGVERKAAMTIAFGQYYSDLSTAYNVHGRARAWPIERAVVEGYERVVWVFKSVDTIGADLARLPFVLREGQSDDDPVVDDHPLYRVLNGKANPLEAGPIFRRRLSAQVLLSKKGAMVERTKSNGGTIKRLDLLPPDRTELIPDRDGNIDHWQLTRRDGSVRNLEPDQVLWFRNPHPTDPYCGTTPLEAAGLSVELDHFARLYNVSFMANDGRPSGIIAVRDTKSSTGEVDPRQQDRIEQKFGKGPDNAGRLSVIAGELSYVDLGAKPRDLQYGATSKNAKNEILSAFGVSETVLGYAAERTFSNADTELYVYWTRTIPGHGDILLAGLADQSEEGLFGDFDKSAVEVLEKKAKERRAEARDEVTAGVRSILSYARLAKMPETEVPDTAYTRALYIPSGKTPIPGREEDAEALGLAVPAGPGGDAGAAGGSAPALPPGEGDDSANAPTGPAAIAAPPETPALPAGGGGGAPSSAARAALDAIVGRKALPAGGGVDPKVLTYRVSRKESSDTGDWSEPSLAAADTFENAVAAALTALSERWIERTVKRIGSPRQRKGTRHFTPEYEHDTRVGTKALDAAAAVDEQTWQQEAEQAAHPIITAAAVAAAIALLADFDVEPPAGLTTAVWAARIVAQTVADVVIGVGRAALNQANTVIAMVNGADQDGDSIADIADAVREHGDRMKSWARGVATQAATATTMGARDAAAIEAEAQEPGLVIDRVWFSRRDARVRETHGRANGADGQVRGLTEPFLVGTALLMRPGDPMAPLRETANCFPADTLVEGAVTGAYRSWYEGPMVTVTTVSGRILTGTPNHPVLTNRGWVGLGALNVGDDLACAGVGEAHLPWPGADSTGAPDVQHPPTRIGEVYRALAQVGAAERVAGASVNFHGDRPNGEVDVVLADGVLRYGIEPVVPEQSREFVLTEAGLLRGDGGTGRSADQLLVGVATTAGGVVSGGSQRGALLSGESGHADSVGGGPITALYAQPVQPSADRGAIDAVVAGERQDGFTGLVPVSDFGKVRHVTGEASVPRAGVEAVASVAVERGWSGHVFNLETASGIYSANGVTVHNCRCYLRHRRRSTGRWTVAPNVTE